MLNKDLHAVFIRRAWLASALLALPVRLTAQEAAKSPWTPAAGISVSVPPEQAFRPAFLTVTSAVNAVASSGLVGVTLMADTVKSVGNGGTPGLTVTANDPDVLALPLLSVATAYRIWLPAATLCQLKSKKPGWPASTVAKPKRFSARVLVA